jgi:hypothetical protein
VNLYGEQRARATPIAGRGAVARTRRDERSGSAQEFSMADCGVATRVWWSTGVAHLLIGYSLCEPSGRSAIPTCGRGVMIPQGLHMDGT